MRVLFHVSATFTLFSAFIEIGEVIWRTLLEIYVEQLFDAGIILCMVNKVDPRTSNGLMFEQLETRTKISRKFRFWNSNKISKVEQLESGTVSWNGLCSKFEVPLHVPNYLPFAESDEEVRHVGELTVISACATSSCMRMLFYAKYFLPNFHWIL
jgi:hypothetical protein